MKGGEVSVAAGGNRRTFTAGERRKLALVLILSGTILIAGAFFIQQWESSQYSTEGGNSDISVELANAEAPAYYYEGQRYVQRDDVETWLIMGIDKDGPAVRGKDAWDGGQADMLQVLVMDHTAKTWQMLAIDRNTLVMIETVERDGTPAGEQFMQICLAHGFSYGLNDGCLKTAQAVKNILLNRKMDRYYALNMGGIGMLNDLVGGVPVTVTEEFLEIDPTLTVGETITLSGEEAEKFVRARMDMQDDRNELRMARQEVYLNSLIDRFDSLSDEELIKAYDAISAYAVTDMGSQTFADLLHNYRSYERLDTVSIDGTAQIENEFETFRMDDVSRIRTSLELFYRAEEG